MKAVDIARVTHEANRAYCIALGDLSQKRWEEAPVWQRDSAVRGVVFKLSNPDSTPKQQHSEWLDTKNIEGWVYGPVKDEEKKTHPCIVKYEDLPLEQQAKDALFGAVVNALRIVWKPEATAAQ